jgi:hypothetical protein
MTNDEAKFLLKGYRPGGHDATDAAMAGALAQARSDPALAAWFTREQAHGAAIASKLREIAPPAGLREAILAGVRVSGPRRSWWTRPAIWGAMAAAVAVLLTVGSVMRGRVRGAAEAEQLATLALDDMQHGRHGGHGTPASELQRWLGSDNARLASAAMPVNYDELKRTGCRTLNLGGHEVLEVCFARGSGPEFHLYVMRDQDMPDLGTRPGPALIAKAAGAAAVWSDSRFHYAVVTDAGADAVKRLL